MPARLRFPDDRTLFVYQQPGEPILTPPRVGFIVYTDEAGTQLADIQTLLGSPIGASTIFVGDDALLPEFLGPPGTNSLWLRMVGQASNSPTELITAQFSEQLAQIPTLLTGVTPPSAGIGVEGSMYLDSTNYVLYGPKTDTDWPTPGVDLSQDGITAGVYEHVQVSPSDVWVIDHPLTYRPSVTVIDSAGTEVWGDKTYLSPTRVQLTFSAPFSGVALLS